MGVESLTVTLNNPDGVYYPGQEVTGVVNVVNHHSLILKGIYLECQGYAKFHYNELNSETYYATEESYLCLKIPLMSSQGERFELVSGDHNFPFSFMLPMKIPASFQTEMLAKFGYGHIQYSIKAVVKRSSKPDNCQTCHLLPFSTALKPSWKPNYECLKFFTVKTLVDLNNIAKAALPIEATKTKIIFGFLCCQAGSINVRIWLDRAGYVPGEVMRLHVEVDNQSRKTLVGSTVNLVECVDFHTHDKSKTYERVISEQKRREVILEPTQVYTISVPHVTPSFLQYCDIIDVSYKLEYILLDSEALSNKLVVPLDVIIGNVPLRCINESNVCNSPAQMAARSIDLRLDQ